MKLGSAFPVIIVLVLAACTSKPAPPIVLEEEEVPASGLQAIGKPNLSDYNFFVGPLNRLEPAAGVVPYALNSPLFSDYAFKKRFVAIPAGTMIRYRPDDFFEFPVGTTLIKNFYYPDDFRKPEGKYRILETRLLILDSAGWKTLPYVWNEAQTDARLEVAGRSLPVQWIHYDGSVRKINYSVPNTNQCKGCHLRGEKISPVGLLARQLNGEYPYAGNMQNQLAHWEALKILRDVAPQKEIPKLVSYDDDHAPLDLRARAWLEVNCAHCHRPDGPARNSGLFLLSTVTHPSELGIGKAPVAAGKGTGGRLFAIVPGKPDESILQYRIESTEAGTMMPEMGRKLQHEEGVELIRQWIKSL